LKTLRLLALETEILVNQPTRCESNNVVRARRHGEQQRRYRSGRVEKRYANCVKERDVGIIGSFTGRREPRIEYRTVDGGHRAPYPDMTDEQLYNYEITFNVSHRTFDRPPRATQPSVETRLPRAQSRQQSQSQPQSQPQPRWRQKTFNAPRYTARKNQAQAARQHTAGPVPALDFGKPVRIVTNKQPVDIITTRARHPIYKVHGYIGNDDVVTVFTLDGRLSENGPCFLENVPQKQQLHLNVYPNRNSGGTEPYLVTQHATKEEADAAAQAGRVACVEVPFDY
jgi:hypothetical protein